MGIWTKIKTSARKALGREEVNHNVHALHELERKQDPSLVPEPYRYRRSTTASRRAAQRKLDESRNKRPTYANRKMLRQVAAGHAPF